MTVIIFSIWKVHLAPLTVGILFLYLQLDSLIFLFKKLLWNILDLLQVQKIIE